MGAKDWNSLPNELKSTTSKQASEPVLGVICLFYIHIFMFLFVLYLLPKYTTY